MSLIRCNESPNILSPLSPLLFNTSSVSTGVYGFSIRLGKV